MTWVILNGLFYFIFYMLPMTIAPWFLSDGTPFDYVIYSNIGVTPTRPNIKMYAPEIPGSDNPHVLSFGPMNYLWDTMRSWAFVTYSPNENGGLLMTSHAFIKVRFALICCYTMSNRVSQLISTRRKFV
jgi:hypothetical protein